MDSANPPWRVFDAPSAEQAGAQRAKSDRAAEGPNGAAGGLGVQPVVLLALGGALLIGAVAVAIALGGGGGVVAGPDSGSSTLGPASSGEVSGLVVVDVVGAVVIPGVYRLTSGARVVDAIDAAGGFSPRVDPDKAALQLNLAATLTDGQQVRVPSRDDPAEAGKGGTATGGPGGSMIDLNSASESELESLPSIGPVTAGKIVEARSQAPFRTIDELRDRGLVGQKTFDSIKALITVG